MPIGIGAKGRVAEFDPGTGTVKKKKNDPRTHDTRLAPLPETLGRSGASLAVLHHSSPRVPAVVLRDAAKWAALTARFLVPRARAGESSTRPLDSALSR
jgi:hypothetical protein